VIERLAADKETEETNDGKTQGLWREREKERTSWDLGMKEIDRSRSFPR